MVGTVTQSVKDTVELTTYGMKTVQEGFQDAKNRATTVKKGIDSILEGAAFVGSGVKMKW